MAAKRGGEHKREAIYKLDNAPYLAGRLLFGSAKINAVVVRQDLGADKQEGPGVCYGRTEKKGENTRAKRVIRRTGSDLQNFKSAIKNPTVYFGWVAKITSLAFHGLKAYYLLDALTIKLELIRNIQKYLKIILSQRA